MKILRLAFTALIITSSIAFAENTPEGMIKLYFDAFKSGDHERMAANMHPDELEKLKKELLPVVARGIEGAQSGMTRDQYALTLFADSEDIEIITNESPAEFFVRFMSWINRMNPMLKNTIGGASIETVGHLMEGDLAHVVYRVMINMSGTRMTQLSVMSVKKSGDEWKLMMSGEIEGMGKLLQRDAPQF
jgi:hypothetical protein